MASVLGKNGLWIGAAVLVICVGLYFIFTRERAFVPEYEEFLKIRALAYDKQTMNCLHKAILYADVLEERGWKRWIAVGKVAEQEKQHAWVIVEDKKGVRRLCDPTTGRYEVSGFPEASYTKYKALAYYDNVYDMRL